MNAADLAQRGYRFALSLTHDTTRAEDLLQDAWHGVLKAGGPRTTGYLFAAIRNRFIDLGRRDKLATFTSLDDGDELGGEAERVEETFALRNGALDSALSQLRSEERAAIYLSVVEEMSAQRIAELFECPRGTVLSLVHRGREKLRRLMNAETGSKT